MSRTRFGMLGVAFLVLSSSATANCWAEFDRPGAGQVGFVLLFSALEHDGEGNRFKGVVGPDDQLEHTIVVVEFSGREGERFANRLPAVVAIVGDVEIPESGSRLIRVRSLLTSADDVRDRMRKSETVFQGTCTSTFSAQWAAG